MKNESTNENQGINWFKDADRLITEIFESDPNEPEPLVRVFTLLADIKSPVEQQDALHHLMTACFNNSLVHNRRFDEFVESCRGEKGTSRPLGKSKSNHAANEDDYTAALYRVVSDLRTPRHLAEPLTIIISNVLDGTDGKLNPQPFANLGQLIAGILADESLPDTILRPIRDAATEVMNQLVEGDEMATAWYRQCFAKAIKRELEVQAS